MKKITAVLIIIVVFTLSACGGVDLYERENEYGEKINTVKVFIDENYATGKGISADKFYNYAVRFLAICGYEEINNPLKEPRYVVEAENSAPIGYLAKMEQRVIDKKYYFLFVVVTVEMDSPFNDFIDEVNGTKVNPSQKSPSKVFLNGYNGGGVYLGAEEIVLSPFYDYFYELSGISDAEKQFIMSYFCALERMDTNGGTLEVDGIKYFHWDSRITEGSDKIQLRYYAPYTVGWSLIAILLGVAAVGIILFKTRTKKKKETLLDKIPYDPNNPIGINDNLPKAF